MRRLPASLSADALKKIWETSRDAQRSRSGGPGVDGIESYQFKLKLGANIAELRREIQMAKFRFGRLRIAPIAKPSGGHRIIAIPNVRDRLLQRALLAHLEKDSRFNASSPISFGFTKGKTLAAAQRHALALRQAHPWVLKADIVQFFDQIPRLQIKKLIRTRVRSRVVADLLCNAVDCELEEGFGNRAEIIQANGIRKGRGLRQGMPVSPLLSNLLLKDFDSALVAKGIRAVRYADDIVVFANSRIECQDALEFIRTALSDLQLRIPELSEDGKTKILGPSEAVEFLGVEIKKFSDVYKLTAPPKKISKIEADMADVCSITRCVADKKTSVRLFVRSIHLSLATAHRWRCSMIRLHSSTDLRQQSKDVFNL